jgi:hypothetical protein
MVKLAFITLTAGYIFIMVFLGVPCVFFWIGDKIEEIIERL